MRDDTRRPGAEHLDPLQRELVNLGRSLAVAPPPVDLADLVLARIATEADNAPVEGVRSERFADVAFPWRRAARPRRLAAVIAAVGVLVIALVPPVRAAVLELLRIGAVTVREVPAPPSRSPLPTTAPPATGAGSPPGAGTVGLSSLAEAEAATGLDIKAPALLGEPTVVALAREGRVVELTWGAGAGTVRLDVIDGRLSFGYLKSVWGEVTPTDVSGREAVWFAEPHLIEWVDRSGATESSAPRVAGPTLVWVDRDPHGLEVTYRLEGAPRLAEALRIARSAHPSRP